MGYDRATSVEITLDLQESLEAQAETVGNLPNDELNDFVHYKCGIGDSVGEVAGLGRAAREAVVTSYLRGRLSATNRVINITVNGPGGGMP